MARKSQNCCKTEHVTIISSGTGRCGGGRYGGGHYGGRRYGGGRYGGAFLKGVDATAEPPDTHFNHGRYGGDMAVSL